MPDTNYFSDRLLVFSNLTSLIYLRIIGMDIHLPFPFRWSLVTRHFASCRNTSEIEVMLEDNSRRIYALPMWDLSQFVSAPIRVGYVSPKFLG